MPIGSQEKRQGIFLSIEEFSRRHPGTIFIVTFGIVCLAAILGSRITLDTDILALVPRGDRAIDAFKTSLKEFGGADYVAALIEARRAKPPAGSYTARLFADTNLRRKKIGEEATELVMALHEETPERIANEAADVIYHVLVACAAAGVPYARIAQVLSERRQ